MGVDDWLLGETIRAARMRKGYTQDQFSEKLGVTLVHLANIEGSRRKPSVPLLFKMMELLDFSVDALVFPERAEERVIHTEQLTNKEHRVLEELVDIFREHGREAN